MIAAAALSLADSRDWLADRADAQDDGAEVAVRVRRAKHGWRVRSIVACGHCGSEFIRLQNRRHCSDLCRLLDKVGKDGTCWLWTATVDRHGYGTFYLHGRNRPAHQSSFLLHGGVIPAGLELDHLCRNRSCVNPGHLEPVTRAENIRRGTRWPSKEAS